MSELTRDDIDSLERLRVQAVNSPASLAAKQAYINGLACHHATLRERVQELEQQLQLREIPSRMHTQALIEESTRVVQQKNAALRQRIAELEQALRLHLAVSSDNPLLLTPVEQQIVMLTAKVELKDRIIKGCVDDLCELEREMETFGMEFTDDYGGLHVPEVISTFIKALTAKVAEVEQYGTAMRITLAAEQEESCRLREQLAALSQDGVQP